MQLNYTINCSKDNGDWEIDAKPKVIKTAIARAPNLIYQITFLEIFISQTGPLDQNRIINNHIPFFLIDERLKPLLIQTIKV